LINECERDLFLLTDNKSGNTMKIKITTIFLLFTAIFFSCKKEEIINNGTSGTAGNAIAPLLSKVLTDNQTSFEYVYNDSNLVTQEKSKFDLAMHHYNAKGLLASTVHYGNDDILSSDLQVAQTALNSQVLVTSENGKKGGIITYEYNNNSQLIKTTYISPSSTNSEYSQFTYGNNSRINRQTMYWDNAATGYIDYTYDAKGNLTKESLYNLPASGSAELLTTTDYVFDNESNPYKATSKLMIPGINTNQNNITKVTYTIHISASNGPDNVQTTETAYEYNAQGYPISVNGNTTLVYN
jgi:hypothetical protein